MRGGGFRLIGAGGWKADNVCGSGIHGWAWGIGVGAGKSPEWNGLWQVYGVVPSDIAGNVGGELKVKFRHGVLRFSGRWDAAARFVLDGQKRWVDAVAMGNNRATGDRSASSATGYSSAAICTGLSSKARGGKYSVVALGWWNSLAQRIEMRCAEIGCGDGSDGKLKAEVWYKLNNDGHFVEDASITTDA